MPTAQQTFVNRKESPIYISIEPNPECYELEPGDRLTLTFEVPKAGDSLEVDFINECELVVWPFGEADEPVVQINGESAVGRSWNFKHFPT